VDQNPVTEVERVFAELPFDEALRRVRWRDFFSRLDECPIGLAPDRVFDLAFDFHVSARRVELPHVVVGLEPFAAAGGRRRFPDELSVSEEIDGVRRDVDGDDRAAARRLVGQSVDMRRVAVAEERLPPPARLLLLRLLLSENPWYCQARHEECGGEATWFDVQGPPSQPDLKTQITSAKSTPKSATLEGRLEGKWPCSSAG
jgi:hypothetical protein